MTLEPLNPIEVNESRALMRRAPATTRLPGVATAPSVTVVDLRIAAVTVGDRATQLVEAARAHGAAHSLRLWREAQREALLALAREAGHAPKEADCRSLAWIRDGTSYHVSAAFTVRPLVH